MLRLNPMNLELWTFKVLLLNINGSFLSIIRIFYWLWLRMYLDLFAMTSNSLNKEEHFWLINNGIFLTIILCELKHFYGYPYCFSMHTRHRRTQKYYTQMAEMVDSLCLVIFLPASFAKNAISARLSHSDFMFKTLR